MNLTSKLEIKNLLQKYQIQPSKGLGQNFLIDRSCLKKVIEAAELKPKDIVLEIGPGLGVLTQELAKTAKKVIAVEKDPRMCEILKETLKEFRNIEVIQGDILKISNSQFLISKQIPNPKCQMPKNYKVVANLPFYVVSPIMRKFLESDNPPKEMILGVQKEVGQRICATPPEMSLLAVSVQFYAEPKIISYISKKSFWPQPKVDSVIIKIKLNLIQKTHDRSFFAQIENRDLFFKIVRAGFSQPRKQLINNLSQKLNLDRQKIEKWLFKNRIRPVQRAETLTIEDWLNLSKSFKIN